MIGKTFTFLLFIVMIFVKTESLVGSISPTKTAAEQPSITQTLFAMAQFNSLPGNPDPDQVKIIYSTTIKHKGIKSKPTDPTNSTSANLNKNFAMNHNSMFNITLIIAFVVAAVMFGI